MTDGDLYTIWGISLAITVVVIILAVVLLVVIWRTAAAILDDAREALDAAEHIAADTGVIWELDTTNKVAVEILDTATLIEERGGRIAATLHHEAPVNQTEEVNS
ncbi:hypothetical protein BH23CHL2_BH23CHL2_35300 [soil metagenome]